MPLLRNLLFWIVLALVGAGIAAFVLSQDPGHVLVRWRGTDYTTTVLHACWMVLGIALALWLAWTLLAWPFRASEPASRPQATRAGRRRIRRCTRAITPAPRNCCCRLATTNRSKPPSSAPPATGTGRPRRRTRDLDGFADRHPASRAIAIAELALQEARPTDALVALDAPTAQPLPPRVALRAEALARSGNPRRPTASSACCASAGRTKAELADRNCAGPPHRCARRRERIRATVEAMPKSLRTEPVVATAHATRAAELGWDEAATKSIERALDAAGTNASPRSTAGCRSGGLEHRRAQAEHWLQAHPGSLALPAALARITYAQGDIAAANGYWQKHWPRRRQPRTGSDGRRLRIAWRRIARAQCYANALRASRGERIAPIDAATQSE